MSDEIEYQETHRTMTQPTESDRPGAGTIIGSWLAGLGGMACAGVWVAEPHPGRGWVAGAILGVYFWAGIWLDYLQRRVEGR